MDDADALKAEIKKLSARAMQAKMDLHDLSEELPVNWDRIPELAQRAYELFRELDAKRKEQKQPVTG
jgi:hypothetical protein